MKNIKLIIFAILVTIVLVPFGVLFNIYNSLKMIFLGIGTDFEYKIGKGFSNFFKYWKIVFTQTWHAISYILYHIAKGLDYIWNATSGELLEQFLCREENTLYGNGEVTVSCATGKEEDRMMLKKLGIRFTKMLNKFFHQKDHCLEAWHEYNIKKQFNN